MWRSKRSVAFALRGALKPWRESCESAPLALCLFSSPSAPSLCIMCLYKTSLLLYPTPSSHFPPLLLSLSLSFSHLHPSHPSLWYPAICVSCASTPPPPLHPPPPLSPRAPDPPRAPPPSSAPPARRRLCRLISSEIGELQARAHMHRHFSCSKRHFRHWKDPGIQNTKRDGKRERERRERGGRGVRRKREKEKRDVRRAREFLRYDWTGLDSFSLSYYPKLL